MNPSQAKANAINSPPEFFAAGPMRYPTMTGMRVDAAGVVADQVVVAKQPEEAKSAP